MSGPSKIKVRQIEESDTNAVVALLLRGFSERTADYWYQAMERLRKRHLPGEFPRFGFGITDDGVLKGVLLIIFSKTDTGDIRANASSWYVEPNYRLFANMLLAQALRIPNVTFVNVSPNPSTLKTIGMQGFVPYVGGTYVALAALAPIRRGAALSRVAAADDDDASTLQYHASLGCLSYEVRYKGETFPFVFLPRLAHRSGFKFAQLVYCRDPDDFRRFAGPLGRQLLKQGYLFVILDANGPVDGLIGHYFEGRKVKCFRGEVPPRLGDLTETELVLFGP
ncbi:MAG: acyl-CoA acyltransferase [Methylovirgula sp.]